MLLMRILNTEPDPEKPNQWGFTRIRIHNTHATYAHYRSLNSSVSVRGTDTRVPEPII